MAISKFTSGTAELDEKEVLGKLKEMNKVAEEHDHEVIGKYGDGQHAEDIMWQVKDDSKKVIYKGSIPMTAHTRGKGNKNMKPAIKDINDAIDYLNGL
jgi:hypothetical protein